MSQLIWFKFDDIQLSDLLSFVDETTSLDSFLKA